MYQSVLAVVRKNCEPFVLGPELAMDRSPAMIAATSHYIPPHTIVKDNVNSLAANPSFPPNADKCVGSWQ